MKTYERKENPDPLPAAVVLGLLQVGLRVISILDFIYFRYKFVFVFFLDLT